MVAGFGAIRPNITITLIPGIVKRSRDLGINYLSKDDLNYKFNFDEASVEKIFRMMTVRYPEHSFVEGECPNCYREFTEPLEKKNIQCRCVRCSKEFYPNEEGEREVIALSLIREISNPFVIYSLNFIRKMLSLLILLLVIIPIAIPINFIRFLYLILSKLNKAALKIKWPQSISNFILESWTSKEQSNENARDALLESIGRRNSQARYTDKDGRDV